MVDTTDSYVLMLVKVTLTFFQGVGEWKGEGNRVVGRG